jgi:2-polyprenyl-3-methyl-5-hydroxy-6-metoxy-1,4-benzoquinol methylase
METVNHSLTNDALKPALISASHCERGVLHALKQKLDIFYGTVSDYSAFETPSEQRSCWEHVVKKIRTLAANGNKVRILEIGAGRSGFGQYLMGQGVRSKCIWTAQDVTMQNADWLKSSADKVIFGDIENADTESSYDIVFSTFVLEHVVNPPAHLARLASLVKPAKGALFIFCPRYDVPGYLVPSSRHLSALTRLQFMLSSSMSRIKTILLGQPAYLIQTDLAAFYQPFFTDSDAVHWVSLYDLQQFARQSGATFLTLKVANPAFPSKDWVVKRLLTVAVCIQF